MEVVGYLLQFKSKYQNPYLINKIKSLRTCSKFVRRHDKNLSYYPTIEFLFCTYNEICIIKNVNTLLIKHIC